MHRIRTFFSASAGEIKNLRSLTLAAFLTAIYAVTYSPVAGNFIIVPGLVEFRIGFLAIAVAGMLFGPCLAMLVAVLGDFIGTLLFYGGGFFLGYTLTWALMGLIFGCALYRYRMHPARVIGAMVLHTVAVNGLLTPLCQSLVGIGPFWPLVTTRLIRLAVMFPINTVLLFAVLKGVGSVYQRLGRPVSLNKQ